MIQKSTRLVIWTSSILRWLLGLVFLLMAYLFRREPDTWMLLLMGTVFFASGFFRPKRCISNQCNR